ncbi:MAG TPA: carboxypeptidase-like regulatory domain-containing protein, partial [Bacteroidia bacterium]|nr:carboxypeptidase-like regulatory domain-containing protein [Bacteroidia bacterium]
MRYLNNAKKSFLLIIANVLFGISCYAQMGVLRGNVYLKQNGEPIAGAGIFPVNDKSIGVASDADGSYEINLPVGKQTIVYTLTGLKNDTLTLDIKDGTESIRNIYLTSNLKNLNVVVVSASKYEQRIEDITVSMEVISPKLIENRNTTNVTSVLEQTPGVTILDQEPQIRGGSGFSFGVGSRVATLIDGLPIMTGDAGRTE